jgi:RNA polymerase sigma factor (TIGR02999 family)
MPCGTLGDVMSDVTQILRQIEGGDPTSASQLLPLVYDELRKLAAAKMIRESPDHTLQPTALVHEAYLRLVDANESQSWEGRGHFFAAAAEAMRRILIENARAKNSERRGGKHRRVDLLEQNAAVDAASDELLLLDEALSKLAESRPEAAELVRLRVFAGLSTEEAAAILAIPDRTARRTWTYAQAWLRRAMQPGDADP